MAEGSRPDAPERAARDGSRTARSDPFTSSGLSWSWIAGVCAPPSTDPAAGYGDPRSVSASRARPRRRETSGSASGSRCRTPAGLWAMGVRHQRLLSLSDWPGGGVIGIHGTNQPQLIPGRPPMAAYACRTGDQAARAPDADRHACTDPVSAPARAPTGRHHALVATMRSIGTPAGPATAAAPLSASRVTGPKLRQQATGRRGGGPR